MSALLASAVISAVFLPLIMIAASRLGVVAAVMFALIIRAVLGFLRLWLTGVSFDAAAYDRYAQWIVLEWQGQSMGVEITTGKEGWSYLLAYLYRVLGHAPEVGILINVLAGTATVLATAAICHELQWERAVRPSAWIIALWPVSLFWGTLLLREALVVFILSLGLLGAVMIRTRGLLVGSVLLGGSGLAMLFMRGGMSIVLLVVLPVLLGLTALATRASGTKRAGRAATILAVGCVAVLTIPFLQARYETDPLFDSERETIVANALDKGATSFSAAGASRGNMVLDTLQILTGPWPWTWSNSALLLAGFDAMLWLSLFTLALIAVKRPKINGWATVLMLIPPIALAFHMTQTGTNFGLIVRLRAMNLPFIVPLAALGLSQLLQLHRASSMQLHSRHRAIRTRESGQSHPGLNADVIAPDRKNRGSRDRVHRD